MVAKHLTELYEHQVAEEGNDSVEQIVLPPAEALN
jgi:hypothetical protein